MGIESLYEAMGVSTGADTGETVTDTQSPAASDVADESEGGTEQEVAEPADNDSTGTEQNGGKKRQSDADNKKFARQRREQEKREAIDAALIEERRKFDLALKNAGIIDPTTKNGKIESYTQLEQLSRSRAAKSVGKALTEGNELTDEQLTQLLQSTESGRKLLRENAAAQAEKAGVYRQQQISLISKIDPAIKSFEDLQNIPEYEVFEGYVRNNGLSWQEAFRLAAGDRLAQKEAAATRQQTLNNIGGKVHRTQDAARGGEGIDLPKDIDELYKVMFPGLTYEQRAAKYGDYLRRTKKG